MPRNGMNLKDFVKSKRRTPLLNLDYDYISVKEYAALVKAHPVTIRCMCLGGGIEGALKLGGCWKIPVKKASRENYD